MKQNTKKTFKFFKKQLARSKWKVTIVVILITIGVTSSILWPIYFAKFIELLSSNESKDLIAKQLVATLGVIILIDVIGEVGRRLGSYINNYVRPITMSNIKNDCFEYLNKHSYDFFSNNFTGSLVKKVNRMADSFDEVYDRIAWDIWPMIIRLTLISTIMMFVNLTLGITIIIWIIIFTFVNYLAAIYKLKFDIAASEASTLTTGALADAITNSSNIKLFAGLSYELEKYTKVTKAWANKLKKAWNVGALTDTIQGILMIGLEIGVLYMAIKLWEQDLLGIAEFFLIQAYLFELFHQLWDFGRVIRSIYEKLAEAEEMTVILDTPLAIKDKSSKKLKVHSGQVEFKKVKFSYENSLDVIHELSFKVKSGEKIALIGPSGGGKSTIIKLILRLFDINSGQILIDNQDISKITQDSLRSQVTLVPQDPVLFHRTLADNIRYGRRDASDEEVIAAAKMAHCHEFISKFPKGYETYVGERGIKLSGGQRQRVAIARAILSNSKILIFDEATSSLDSESETLIQDALNNLVKQKTTFIIAHRLSTIMHADRIFVLENGRIIEEGKHNHLLKKQNSLYKKLWDLQVGGYM